MQRGWRIFPIVAAMALACPSHARAEDSWLRGEQILIQFTGVLDAPPGLHRTKEEARRRAMKVIAQVLAGASFADLAREYSDDPVGRKTGGDLGLIGPGVLVPELEETLRGLNEGEVAPVPVLTAFGFHVVRRLPSEPRIVIRHILIAYAGALRARAGLRRTRDQAKALAMDIESRLSGGASFAQLAKTLSDDPGSASKGGLLGEFRRGLAVRAFEQAAFALDPGGTSDVVETPFGFDIIHRDR